ncbi:MAG: hypothetical protein J6D21_08325 [Clostridia bacterium]|nr:hypothetical protein [Clostridia bacterium]
MSYNQPLLGTVFSLRLYYSTRPPVCKEENLKKLPKMVKNLLTITENGGNMVSQITENGKNGG